jgi:predicted AAA+ superfamily ATPase
MIKRNLAESIKSVMKGFPVIAVTGPRQSGKTTLIRELFSDYAYFNLENPNTLMMIEADPLGFISDYPSHVVIDEIQKYPALLSYIQTTVDSRKEMGAFVISGSENLLLSEKIGQSLAGRAAYATLLPLSRDELEESGLAPVSIYEQLFRGGYPALYDREITAEQYYSQYLSTYVERDARMILNIANLNAFTRFLFMAAGRIGQVLNLSSMAGDVGVSSPTIDGWLSVLEASDIAFRLYPYYNNFGKRFIKSPKLYFYDTGLACNLLSLKSSEELKQHYLLGGLFENYCITELLKKQTNAIERPSLYFFRDSKGNEVDVIAERGAKRIPIEIKAGKTYSGSFLRGLEYWKQISAEEPDGYVIYTGASQKIGKYRLINWQEIHNI